MEYLQTWGEHGDGPGQLNSPIAFTVDTQGRVYFVDPTSDFLDKFESNGVPLFSFEDYQVRHTDGIAVDSGGAIYLANAQRGEISILFPEGIPLRAQHFPPQPHLEGPYFFHVDDAGNLYLPDILHSRILKFDDRGRLAKSWSVPHAAPVDGDVPMFVATSQDGSLFVAFPKTGRIEKYSPDGVFVSELNAPAQTSGDSSIINGLAVSGNYVFALMATAPHLKIWTADGVLKLEDNLGGRLDTVSDPQIGMTPQRDLLVFEPHMSHVLRFRIHL